MNSEIEGILDTIKMRCRRTSVNELNMITNQKNPSSLKDGEVNNRI